MIGVDIGWNVLFICWSFLGSGICVCGILFIGKKKLENDLKKNVVNKKYIFVNVVFLIIF